MSVTLTLKDPAGNAYDVTSGSHAAIADSLPDLTLQLEDSDGKITAGDISLTFRNDDGWFTSQWANLDPESRWSETTGNGCWIIQIRKGGVLRWVGDLDVQSVAMDTKHRSVTATFLGPLKRLERYNAGKTILTSGVLPPCCRVDSAAVTACTWVSNRKVHPRVLWCSTMPVSLRLQVKDVLKYTKLKALSKVISQELEIIQTSAENPNNLPALPTFGGYGSPYAVRVRKRLKCDVTNNTAMVCTTPFWRDLTPTVLAGKLFDQCGVSAGARSITLTEFSANPNVEYFDLAGKSVSEGLGELAAICNAVLFYNAVTAAYYMVSRDQITPGNTPKNIDSLLMEEAAGSIWERFYHTIKVKGSKDITKRVGGLVYPSNELEVNTDYVSDTTWLQQIAERLYAWLGVRRQPLDVTVLDDGTAYQIWDQVLRAAKTYHVIGVTEPMRAVDSTLRSSIQLKLLAKTGTAPTTGDGETDDQAEDDSPPEPPTNLEITKTFSEWPLFRQLYPAEDFPKWVVRASSSQDSDDNITVVYKRRRLWAVRFRWDQDDKSGRLLGFHLNKFPEVRTLPTQEDRDKPLGQDNWADPVQQSDGYYYWPPRYDGMTYVRGARKVGFEAQTVFEDGQISAASDPVYTSEENDDDPEKPSPATFTSLNSYIDDDGSTTTVDTSTDVVCGLVANTPKAVVRAYIKNNDNLRIYTAHANVEDADTTCTIHFHRICATGKSLTLKRIEVEHEGKIATTVVNYNFTAGGGSGQSVPTPSVGVVAWNGAGYNVPLTWGAGLAPTSWYAYAAPYGTTTSPNPPTSAGLPANTSVWGATPANTGNATSSGQIVSVTQYWDGTQWKSFSSVGDIGLEVAVILGNGTTTVTYSAAFGQGECAPGTPSIAAPLDEPYSYAHVAGSYLAGYFDLPANHGCDRLRAYYQSATVAKPARATDGILSSPWTQCGASLPYIIDTSADYYEVTATTPVPAQATIVACIGKNSLGPLYGDWGIVHYPSAGLGTDVVISRPSSVQVLWVWLASYDDGSGITWKLCRASSLPSADPPDSGSGNGWELSLSGSSVSYYDETHRSWTYTTYPDNANSYYWTFAIFGPSGVTRKTIWAPKLSPV